MFDYNRIQDLLDAKRMSAIDMCKTCGISSGNVSDWKSGRSAPSATKLIAIADYFGVSVDYLMGRSSETILETDDERELLKIYKSADREGKTMILAAALTEKRRMNKMGE